MDAIVAEVTVFCIDDDTLVAKASAPATVWPDLGWEDEPSKPDSATIWAMRTEGIAMNVINGKLPSLSPCRSFSLGF